MKKRIFTQYIHNEEVEFKFGRYASGELAISMVDPVTGEPIGKVTVSAEPYGCEVIDHNKQIYLKDYGENAGMLKAMRDAGVIKESPTHTRMMGSVVVYICDLTDETINALKEAKV
jgi:hypothetical protein